MRLVAQFSKFFLPFSAQPFPSGTWSLRKVPPILKFKTWLPFSKSYPFNRLPLHAYKILSTISKPCGPFTKFEAKTDKLLLMYVLAIKINNTYETNCQID